MHATDKSEARYADGLQTAADGDPSVGVEGRVDVVPGHAWSNVYGPVVDGELVQSGQCDEHAVVDVVGSRKLAIVSK